MSDDVRITNVAFVSAGPKNAAEGLLGWITCVVNDTLVLDGLTLRKTRDGRLTLSYPARRDAEGKQHFILRPIDDGARLDLENQILTALGCREEAS